MTWTSGYVADIDYTFGYYPELNPLNIDLALAKFGLQPPKIKNACELGFGQGLSLCVNSLHPEINWYGNDFNPTQALFAKELSSHANKKPFISDEDFVTFCSRQDLPEFDFISLHGIWSWISAENRKVILEFVKKKLAVGGVLYISYNTEPGWATMMPMRNLLTRYVNNVGAQGISISKKIDEALQFADALMATNPIFKNANPQVQKRLELINDQDRNYLAHEYFNADWQPFNFSEMNDILTEAKLTYAGPANFADGISEINLTATQSAFLDTIENPIFREMVRDMCVNQSFRKDFWVKGARNLSNYERAEFIHKCDLTLISDPRSIKFKIKGNLGEADLTKDIYDPIISAFDNCETLSIRDLSEKLSGVATELQILQAVSILIAKNDLAVAMSRDKIDAATSSTTAINLHLLRDAISKDEVKFLVSPVTLSVIPVSRFEKLFILALQNKCSDVRDIANYVWDLINPQGQRLVVDGKTLQKPEENIDKLETDAMEFLNNKLQKLIKLKIVNL